MGSEYEFSAAFLAELKRAIVDRGIVVLDDDSYVPIAKVPSCFDSLLGKSLPSRPLAVAVDVYGTLLASAVGDIGPVADWNGTIEPGNEPGGFKGTGFPHDMAERLRQLVVEDHAAARAKGIRWPEVDSPHVFARALGLDIENGARACVAWECAMNPCSVMPGAAHFLHCCVDHGVPLGIVSNAQFYTPLFVEAAFNADLYAGQNTQAAKAGKEPSENLGFDPELTLWSFQTGRAKPDDWMFGELVRRLALRGVPADRILFVGNDALNDCAAAGEAGMMTALFCGDARSFRPRLEDPTALALPPTILIQSWDELWRIVCT